MVWLFALHFVVTPILVCAFFMICVGTAWLLGVIVAGQCGGQSWFVDLVHVKFASTIDCLLSFVHFRKPGPTATSRVSVLW